MAGFQDQRRFSGYVTEQQNNVADVHVAFTDSSECWKSKLVPKGFSNIIRGRKCTLRLYMQFGISLLTQQLCDTSQTALLILHSVSGVF